jgi:catechol 2,3-dioxygenase-like lactoylglutathione lyase family enzyme
MIEKVISVGFTVSDLDKAVRFYKDVLQFELIDIVEVYGTPYEELQGVFGLRMRVATLKLGSETLELTEYLTPKGRPIPADSRSNDGWFQHIAIVVSDMEQAYHHLRNFKVTHVSTAPQTLPNWNIFASGIEAFYFRDPDGHNLELIYYPEGKGDPRWQRQNSLFLGIDHTAIAVGSTFAASQLYKDLLGFGIAGESLNYGKEQEHLNLVEGARLKISSLRAKNRLGIEFLEYLNPRTGRPMPQDTRANDLWYWQTTLATPEIENLAKRLRCAGYKLISSNVVRLPDCRLGFNKGFIVRDPDGHALRVVELERAK